MLKSSDTILPILNSDEAGGMIHRQGLSAGIPGIVISNTDRDVVFSQVELLAVCYVNV